VKKIVWSERALAEIRMLDRKTAMRIFAALARFAESGEGDIKRLQGTASELRLRVGDYRVRFTEEPADILHIHSVRHRKDAYR
jgi:mRNA interferase RelE/StbE